MNSCIPPPHVHQVSTGDGTVLLDTSRGRFYGLNPTGAIVWRALSAGLGQGGAVRELTACTGAPPDRARADVAVLVDALQACGLLAADGGVP